MRVLIHLNSCIWFLYC